MMLFKKFFGAGLITTLLLSFGLSTNNLHATEKKPTMKFNNYAYIF